ncbi:DUF397 domain-containing protein [Streptomyces sp. NPDC047973]|uniref:DUF397 domain-containing protein n=1 Tax=Streptomyces sp. NPDC047973 TaxID=3155383 RepID=UPI00343C8C37
MTVHQTLPIVNGLVWFKSSYSTGNGGECVEVAAAVARVHIRDSKQTGGPVLSVSPRAWAGLVRLVTD